MASNTHKNNDNANKVQNMFDQILCRHMERLIGTSYGIGALPMNSTTISCLTLLMERENEIENFPSDAQERYTAETLISELDEMGFSLGHNIKTIIEDMIRKDYINVDDHNKLIPDKPTISMAQLLDRTFPQMPGMNLVAYFIQTMDEVKSERKDLDSAINQFNQILQMQGVSLINEQSQTDTEKTSTPSVEQKTQLQKSEASLKKGKGSDILGRLKPATWSKQSRVSPSEPKILSSDAFAGKL